MREASRRQLRELRSPRRPADFKQVASVSQGNQQSLTLGLHVVDGRADGRPVPFTLGRTVSVHSPPHPRGRGDTGVHPLLTERRTRHPAKPVLTGPRTPEV